MRKPKASANQTAPIPSTVPTTVQVDPGVQLPSVDAVTGISGYTNPEQARERLGQPSAQQWENEPAIINAAAIYQYRQARWQPISLLTPETLTSQLAEWNVGSYRRFSLTMDAVENRDLLVKGATGKLKMALARRNFEIVKVEGADEDEAEAHSQALRYFYSNCSATSAVDRNIRGGFGRLVQFMMDAALKRYAPFEIVWQPKGEMLTATFIHVPLWFFENRTGSLRFAGNFAWDGVTLKDGKWMVAVGEGIMESIVVGWMYKTLALRDWMIYSERNGMPVPYVKTPNAKNSAAWEALRDTLTNLGPDTAFLVGLQDEVGKLDFGAGGTLPYPLLVEYIDKAIIALARGADLGTMSAHGAGGEGQGASLQGDESDLIEQHYGAMVSETLNHYVDPWVLRWHFGDEVTPAAYVRLDVPTRKDTNMDLQVDEKLINWGVELSVDNALERYGRTEAQDGEKILSNPMMGGMGLPPGEGEPEAQPEGEGEGEAAFADAKPVLTRPQARKLSKMFLGQTHRRLCREVANETRPLKQRLENLLELKNDGDFTAALRGLRSELPRLTRRVDGKSRRELEGVLEINRL